MANTNIFQQILAAEGRPLAVINPGSDEVALSRDATIRAINALNGTETAILGGDVLVDDGQLRYANANWHCDRQHGEALREYAERSREVARIYVNAYPKDRANPPLFVLVWDSP